MLKLSFLLLLLLLLLINTTIKRHFINVFFKPIYDYYIYTYMAKSKMIFKNTKSRLFFIELVILINVRYHYVANLRKLQARRE
jgi:hypothetical protein